MTQLGNLACTLAALALCACACAGGGGGATSPGEPVVIGFTATPDAIVLGASSELRPVFEDGDGRIEPGVGPVASGSVLTVAPEATTFYALVVTSAGGERTVAELAPVWVNVPPEIVDPPDAAVVPAGGLIVLRVAAEGNGTLAYQWQKDGVELAGATSATWTLADAQPGDSGAYRVVVTNGYHGTVTATVSPAAPVVVTPPSS